MCAGNSVIFIQLSKESTNLFNLIISCRLHWTVCCNLQTLEHNHIIQFDRFAIFHFFFIIFQKKYSMFCFQKIKKMSFWFNWDRKCQTIAKKNYQLCWKNGIMNERNPFFSNYAARLWENNKNAWRFWDAQSSCCVFKPTTTIWDLKCFWFDNFRKMYQNIL